MLRICSIKIATYTGNITNNKTSDMITFVVWGPRSYEKNPQGTWYIKVPGGTLCGSW